MALEGINTGGAIEDGELSKDDLLDLLNADDEADETSGTYDTGAKDSRDDDEVKDDVEETDEEDETDDDDDEDDEELVTPVRRKEILAKYPDLFKHFPHLEKASYSDQQFRELFGTHDDAKEAADKAASLDGFEADLREGNTEAILRAVKDSDGDAFNTIVDEYLATLAKVDRSAYLHVVSEVLKTAIVHGNATATSTKDDELSKAVERFHRYLFQSDKFEPHQKLGKTVDKEGKNELDRERQAFLQERYDTARSELRVKIENVLKGTVDESIDTRDSMSPYVKKNAIRDAMSTLDQVIRADTSFMKVLDGLWKKASDNKFDAASMKRIRSTYLSKAKTHLPAVIKRSRREALQGQGKQSRSVDKVSRDSQDRDKSGRRPPSSSSSSKSKTSDGRGKSTLDYFNED